MHCIYMVLGQRLRDGIAAVVQQQTLSLLPHLREQVADEVAAKSIRTFRKS